MNPLILFFVHLQKLLRQRNLYFMRGLRFRLPPMNAVVAFEAVSRHMSVTRAAEELLVSREAVSRHIRVLETYLGARLFVRLQKSLELTSAGREFSERVKRSLDLLSEATGKFRTQKSRRRFPAQWDPKLGIHVT